MKKLLAALVIAGAVATAHAEDFGLWTEVGISQNLGVRGLSADLGYDIRFNNHLKGATRRSFNVGLNYSLTRNIKVGAAYAYIYSFNLPENETKYRTDDEGNIQYDDESGLPIYRGYNYTHSYWRNKHRIVAYIKGDIDI